MHSDIPFKILRQPAPALPGFTLHYAGTATVLATITPDDTWPEMYRVCWPNGTISDLANLTRARDAAEVIAERGPPHRKAKLLRWRPIALSRRAQRSPLVRFPARVHEDPFHLREIGGVQ